MNTEKSLLLTIENELKKLEQQCLLYKKECLHFGFYSPFLLNLIIEKSVTLEICLRAYRDILENGT
jgi:hypothetical protein